VRHRGAEDNGCCDFFSSFLNLSATAGPRTGGSAWRLGKKGQRLDHGGGWSPEDKRKLEHRGGWTIII